MKLKRDEGRDETVVEPELPIVDARIHLFDGRPAPRYLLPEYLADATAGHRIVASVYVESHAFFRQDGPELLRQLGEVEFANGVGAMAASGVYGNCRVCAGIVAPCDLTLGDAVAEYLDRAVQVAPDRMRGVRQVMMEDPSGRYFRHMMMAPPQPGLLRHPRLRDAVRHLAPRGPDRCMMESNFPPDGRSCGYVPLWNALKTIVRDCTPAEKTALFSGTASRVYRLPP